MIAQKIYLVFMLILFVLSWKLGHAATEQIRKAHETQAKQIERILALE